MTYTTISDVRALSKLTENDISDTDLTIVINNSSAEVNSKVNVRVIREKAEYLDEIRQNKVDGINDTFYVKNWKDRFISDANNDYVIDASDVTVYQIKDNVETILTVSSISHDEGKVVLSSAPEDSSQVLLTYKYSSFDMSTPDTLINLAATYLSIATGYLKKDAGVPTNVKFSSISISRKLSDSYGVYMDRYNLVLQELNSKNTVGGFFAEAGVRI